jgi:hypothetical protein
MPSKNLRISPSTCAGFRPASSKPATGRGRNGIFCGTSAGERGDAEGLGGTETLTVGGLRVGSSSAVSLLRL